MGIMAGSDKFSTLSGPVELIGRRYTDCPGWDGIG